MHTDMLDWVWLLAIIGAALLTWQAIRYASAARWQRVLASALLAAAAAPCWWVVAILGRWG